MIGAVAGISAMTWFATRLLQHILPLIPSILLANAIVLIGLASTYDEGFGQGFELFWLPQAICLAIFLSVGDGQAFRPRFGAAGGAQSLDVETSVNRESNQLDQSSVKSRRRWNVIANHWRGEYSLATSFWIIGIFATVIVSIILVGMDALLLNEENYKQGNILFSLVFVWAVAWAIGIWQDVGIWRSANRRIGERALASRLAIWAGVAKLVTALTLVYSFN